MVVGVSEILLESRTLDCRIDGAPATTFNLITDFGQTPDLTGSNFDPAEDCLETGTNPKCSNLLSGTSRLQLTVQSLSGDVAPADARLTCTTVQLLQSGEPIVITNLEVGGLSQFQFVGRQGGEVGNSELVDCRVDGTTVGFWNRFLVQLAEKTCEKCPHFKHDEKYVHFELRRSRRLFMMFCLLNAVLYSK